MNINVNPYNSNLIIGQKKMASYFILDKNYRPLVQRSCASNHRFILFLIIITLCNFIVLYSNVHHKYFLQNFLSDENTTSREDESSYIIYTEGCQIPNLPLYDESLAGLMEAPLSFQSCPKDDRPMVEINESHIWVIKENLKYHYNSTGEKSNLNVSRVVCCYKEIRRPAEIMNITGSFVNNRVATNRRCKIFSDIIAINLKYEFGIVSCNYTNLTQVYTKLFAYAPKKSFMSREGVTPLPGNSSQYNVLVIGVDSVSRLNFHRAMPKTRKFLISLRAVELLGYNKVGDDTFANAMALLMGLRHMALKTTCLPYRTAPFDNCPLVWEWFKQAGYYTALGEDSSKYGIFNYLRGGFHGFPTDYYLHPFVVLTELMGSNYHELFKKHLCLQGKFMYEVLLDYIEKLTETLANNKLFGFFWDVNLSHDSLNSAKAIDVGYERFFRRLHESGYLEKTIVIFLSDHGMRFGEIFLHNTDRGRLETRLPLAYVLVPPSFRANYSLAYNFLTYNSKRLTTPFDMHKTLLDLINLKSIENEAIGRRSKQYYTKERGISLFLPIPGNRTCKTADIDDTWCTCHRNKKISVNGKEVKQAADDLIVFLNNLLSEHRQCAKLTLWKIQGALAMNSSYGDGISLTVTVRVKPSNGKMEATMRKVDRTWQPVGLVSRLNRYGEQSRCMMLPELKLYCFCRDYNSTTTTDYKSTRQLRKRG